MRFRYLLASLLLFLPWRVAAGADTFTTNDFIQLCSTELDQYCLSKFRLAEIAVGRVRPVNPAYRHCRPVYQFQTRELMIESVKSQVRVLLIWLQAHPQYGPQSAAPSIGVALHSIYPCK